jgi:uncharacterized membrane protein
MNEQKKENIKKEGQEIKTEFERAKTEFKTEIVDSGDPKVIAAIGYLWILFLVPLLYKKNEPLCLHHGKQGLVLFIFSILISIISAIPIIGWFIGFLGWLAVLGLTILGIINALRGDMWEMPYLGKYAKKIKI